MSISISPLAYEKRLSYLPISLFAGILQAIGIKGFVYKPRMKRDFVPTVEAVLK